MGDSVKSKKNWHGIMTVDYFQHIRDGKVLFEQKNIKNLLHVQGEQQILNALFVGGNTSNAYIPSTYFLGLDDRTTLSASDTLTSLVSEPVSGGYARQGVSATTGFTIETSGTSVKATTGIVTYSCTTSSWGPVRNLFLTNVGSGTAGILYSSVALSNTVTLAPGDSITLKFSLSLGNC